jgi:uncharacterized membrane protein
MTLASAKELAPAQESAQPSANWDVAVKPWSYNPSSWRQRIPICLLACVAFLIATHLALYQWRLIDSVWDPVFGAESARVLDSEVAGMMHGWFGIPDAALGALAYLGDAIFGLAGSTRRWQYRPWLVILFGIDVIPLGLVSAILVLCQAFVVGHWCFLCLITAVISLALVYLSYDEVYSSLKYLYLIWKRTRSWRSVWNATWGRPSAEAIEAGKLLEQSAQTA